MNAEQHIVLTRPELDKLVNDAASLATQYVAAKNRHRLFWWGAMAGAAAAALVAFVLAYSNSRSNCHLITRIADVAQQESEEASASTKSFEAKSKDRFGLKQSEFDKLIQEGKERRARHIATLRGVAKTNCALPVR